MLASPGRVLHAVWVAALLATALALAGPAGWAGPSATAATAPANDDFLAAQSVDRLPAFFTVDTTAATLEPGEPTSCGQSHTAWYRFSPTVDTGLQAYIEDPTGSGHVAIYSGTALGALTLEGCGVGTFGQQVEIRALGGTTYYVQVGSSQPETVNLRLLGGPALPNDDFADASAVTDLPSDVAGFTYGATVEAAEPLFSHYGDPCSAHTPDGAGLANTVWFTYTPTADTGLTVSTEGSSFDTAVLVYTGDSLTALERVPGACNDDVDPTYPDRKTWSRVSFQASAGTTYSIQVGSSYCTDYTGCYPIPAGSLHVSFSETPGCTGRIEEDIDHGIVRFGGGWEHARDPLASGDGVELANRPGAEAAFTFPGRGTRLIATTGPRMGTLEIFVDGKPWGTADLYSPTIKHQRIVALISGLPNGGHTVTYRVSAHKNPKSSGYWCPLDRFDHHTNE